MLSQKIYLKLDTPVEDAPLSDQQRLETALNARGFEPVSMPLRVLQKLYPLCRAENGITATLVYRNPEWVIVNLEKGDQTYFHYGLAVDYGSTTVHMQMVDLNSGTVVATEKMESGQIAYGTDILTRITFSLEHPDHAQALRLATLNTFHSLLDHLTEATGVNASALSVMTVSGNTTMIHFLLGLNAWTVFAAPYAPVTTNPGWFWGEALGLDFSGLIYIIPAASNYVGGDIVSGLLALDIQKSEDITLFFDIGTNGELVLGNKDWIVAGAGAAGPALEGYISRYGMRAIPGAIDHVTIENQQLRYTTINGKPPVGICGSGIIDLLAQMRLAGWIDISGRLAPEMSQSIIFLEAERQYAAVYALKEDGQPLFFTQQDIDQYCDTKAASFTMIECLLQSVGCSEQDIARCHLSGAFPYYSDLRSAITIGMFPDLPLERYSCAANTSLDGARRLLLNRELMNDIQELTQNLYCVQFASIPDFLVRMQAAKFIPHTDMDRFPSVQKQLRQRKSGEA